MTWKAWLKAFGLFLFVIVLVWGVDFALSLMNKSTGLLLVGLFILFVLMSSCLLVGQFLYKEWQSFDQTVKEFLWPERFKKEKKKEE